MALKILLLRKQLNDEETRAAELRTALAAFDVREAEIAASIEEVKSDEERAAVEEAVESFETEKRSAAEAVAASDERIADLRAQIAEAEEAQRSAMEAGNTAENKGGAESRGKDETMNTMDLRSAQEFQKTGKHTYADIRSMMRAALKSNSTGVVGPTGVNGVNDAIGSPSTLIDMLKITDCTGMSSYKVACMTADASDASAITEGSTPSESEPTFASVELTPSNYGTIGYVSKEIRKQTPLNYAEKVEESARRSLRRKMNSVAVTAILASSLNDTLALEAASTATKGDVLFDGSLLSNIILGYGGDEDVYGNAVLFLNKADLKAFAAVRGKNEYLPVYSITPDTNNPNCGVIKDNNGLSCRYCLSKDLTALSTATLSTTAAKHMIYGVPTCAEMAMWGGFDVEVNDGYKFGEGLLTVRGEVTGDVDVTVKHGFEIITAKKGS